MEPMTVKDSTPLIIGGTGTLAVIASSSVQGFSFGLLASAWGVPESLSIGLTIAKSRRHFS